jgi:hypothetical protein
VKVAREAFMDASSPLYFTMAPYLGRGIQRGYLQLLPNINKDRAGNPQAKIGSEV